MIKDEKDATVEIDEPLVEKPEDEAKASEKSELRTKIKPSRGKIKNLEEENLQLKEKYLRLAAEFDNFKKLMAKEVENRLLNIKEALILDILPVLDDLDRTLGAVSEEEKSSAIGKGVIMIRANMKQILSNYGLQEIKSVGEEFDIDLHEALMMIKDENFPPNVVAQEHQKGYKLNNRVIRHSKVAVNKID